MVGIGGKPSSVLTLPRQCIGAAATGTEPVRANKHDVGSCTYTRKLNSQVSSPALSQFATVLDSSLYDASGRKESSISNNSI